VKSQRDANCRQRQQGRMKKKVIWDWSQDLLYATMDRMPSPA
jgi:hypothetical protein